MRELGDEWKIFLKNLMIKEMFLAKTIPSI